MLRYSLHVCAVAILVFAAAAGARAQSEILSVELNKVEQSEEGCRFSLLIENESDIAFAEFGMDLALFDQGGVLATRVTANIGKLQPDKIHLRTFVIESLDCSGVGRVPLNDVTACRHDSSAPLDCLEAVDVSHRGAVALVK